MTTCISSTVLLICEPPSVPAAFPDYHVWRESSAFRHGSQAVNYDLPREMWLIKGKIHPNRMRGLTFGEKI